MNSLDTVSFTGVSNALKNSFRAVCEWGGRLVVVLNIRQYMSPYTAIFLGFNGLCLYGIIKLANSNLEWQKCNINHHSRPLNNREFKIVSYGIVGTVFASCNLLLSKITHHPLSLKAYAALVLIAAVANHFFLKANKTHQRQLQTPQPSAEPLPFHPYEPSEPSTSRPVQSFPPDTNPVDFGDEDGQNAETKNSSPGPTYSDRVDF
jgi:hypothetical protein